jgi:hypothetical protein
MRYDNSVGDFPVDICELFANLFESVYNVDNCGSDTEDMSDPSDGCGFSSIRLRMSDLEAAIYGLDANKGPGNDGVPPSFVKPCVDGLKSHFHLIGRIHSYSFLFSRPVNVMMLVIIVVWQYFHAL